MRKIKTQAMKKDATIVEIPKKTIPKNEMKIFITNTEWKWLDYLPSHVFC